jgi:predicted dehydrogenase
VWRIGVLSGTGTALKRIIPALVGSDVCRVTVVHGRNVARLRDVLELDSTIRVVGSEAEFAELRARYDIVYIASPPFLHGSHIGLAAGLGLPIICEKPLVTDYRELRSTVRLVEDAGVPFMLGHHVRHQRAVADLVDLVRTERLGRPISASLQWCFMMDQSARNARWKSQPHLGGPNAMWDAGVHAIDLAILLFGLPDRVSAVGHHVRSTAVFDSAVALLDYSGYPVTVVASQSGHPRQNDLRITFSSAAIHAPALLGETSAREIELLEGSRKTQLTYEPVDLYRAEVENFCRSLDASVTAGTTIHEAAAATSVLAVAEESMRTGQMLRVPVTTH